MFSLFFVYFVIENMFYGSEIYLELELKKMYKHETLAMMTTKRVVKYSCSLLPTVINHIGREYWFSIPVPTQHH